MDGDMFERFGCLAVGHDLLLVALAGLICFLASLAAIGLFQRARATFGWARRHDLMLQTALEHMNQGLCMFDKEQRLVVSNRRYAEMFGIAPGFMRPGITGRQIAEHRVAIGQYPGTHSQKYIEGWLDSVAISRSSKTLLEFENGRVYSVSHVAARPTTVGSSPTRM